MSIKTKSKISPVYKERQNNSQTQIQTKNINTGLRINNHLEKSAAFDIESFQEKLKEKETLEHFAESHFKNPVGYLPVEEDFVTEESRKVSTVEANLDKLSEQFNNFTGESSKRFEQPSQTSKMAPFRPQTSLNPMKNSQMTLEETDFDRFQENRNKFCPSPSYLRSPNGFSGRGHDSFFIHPEDKLTEKGLASSWNRPSNNLYDDNSFGYPHDSISDFDLNQRSSTPSNGNVSTNNFSKRSSDHSAMNAPYRSSAIALPSPRSTRKASNTDKKQPVFSYLNSYAFTKPTLKKAPKEDDDFGFYGDQSFVDDGFNYNRASYAGYDKCAGLKLTGEIDHENQHYGSKVCMLFCN